ncbi:acyl-CoA N-acyltransferase [Acrodontium crateriforme]|uniref:Acyl-CoA N-acyltransferase n=1 Tax=Acrodontium crateriforme TaxID=150365 RepID=A0AAQ3LZQ3_9PEZI|nr:acyl-CoA N-acyltransferase [Acrodontium crateriforme]
MPFTLAPLQKEDIQASVEIYFLAFQNAHSLACWPRTPSIQAWWTEMLDNELTEPGAHWVKTIDSQTGELAGFGKWQEPKPGVSVDDVLPEWPREADGELCQRTFGEWARRHRDLMGARGHWYLEIVATHPKFQGQGAGSLMLRYGTERADAAGVEAYLEASPEAVPLYEKFGFREVGRTDTFINNERVKETWYRNLFMLRPAKRHEEITESGLV